MFDESEKCSCAPRNTVLLWERFDGKNKVFQLGVHVEVKGDTFLTHGSYLVDQEFMHDECGTEFVSHPSLPAALLAAAFMIQAIEAGEAVPGSAELSAIALGDFSYTFEV